LLRWFAKSFLAAMRAKFGFAPGFVFVNSGTVLTLALHDHNSKPFRSPLGVAGNRPHVNKIRRKRAAQLPFRRANKSKASNPDALNLNYSFFLGKLSHRKPHECMNTLLPAASKETP
jgi:hypothetical protein